MRIRRVDAWDFMHEADNAAPTKFWINVDGDWDIVTRKLKAAHDGGTTIGTVHFGSAVAQDERLLYDIDMDIISTSLGWWAALIIQADAQVGRYLGNSIVIYIDETDIKVYTSANNVLTQRLTATLAHSVGNAYRLEVDFDPTNGNIIIKQDVGVADAPEATTEVVNDNVVGWPFAGNVNMGLACEDTEVDFDWFQVHRPDYEQIEEGSVAWSHFLSKTIDWARFAVGIDEDKSMTQEFQKGNWVEIIVENGTTQFRETFIKLEKTEWDTAQGVLRCEGRGLMQQMALQHADYATGAATQGAQIIELLDTYTDDLPSIDVKAGGDVYVVTYQARSTWGIVGSLAKQLGYAMWQTEFREIMATDVFPASGLTIDTDNDVVLDAKDVEDLYDMCNDIEVYYHGAMEQASTDAGSIATYGKRGGASTPGGVETNHHISAKGMAANEADYWVDNYKDPVEAVMVQVADFHELNVGDTVTLNIDHLGLAGSSALVAEKHYRDGQPFFTFLCVIYAVNPLLRWNRDPAQTMQDAKRMAQDNAAWTTEI